MNLFITKSDSVFILEIKAGGRIIDSATIPFGPTLEQELLENLDIFFKRNKMDKSNLKRVIVANNLDKNSTAFKVLTVLKKALSL